jgi:biopolymer transport protein ExbD
MSRFRNLSDQGDEASIDMSPLIDCVFILLIFFIVTTVFVEESGIPTSRPESSNASSSDENESVVFFVKEDGSILFEGREIGLHGVGPTVSRKIQKEMVPVIIQSERKAKYGQMLSVMDAAMVAGAQEVSVDSSN